METEEKLNVDSQLNKTKKKRDKVELETTDEYHHAFEMFLKKKEKYTKERKKYLQSLIENKTLTMNEKKMNLKRYQTKCLECKRNVGMIFKETDNELIILCGDRTSPCKIDKTIKKKHFDIIPSIISKIEEIMKEIKTQIIKLKYDSIFELKKETIIQNEFQTLKTKFIQLNGQFNILLMKQKEYENQEKSIQTKQIVMQKYIQNIKTKMTEYSKSLDNVILSEVIDIYSNEIYPIMQEINNYYLPKIIVSSRNSDNETLLHEYTVFKYYNQKKDLEIEITKT